MITLGKKGDLHARRQALSFLQTDNAVKRCLKPWLRATATETAVSAHRPHGFQRGDGAEKAFIELLGAEKQLEQKAQKRADLKAKKRAELEKQLEESKKDEKARAAKKLPKLLGS